MAENNNNERKTGFWGFADNAFEKHPWISMFTVTGIISGIFAGIKGIILAIRKPKDSWREDVSSAKEIIDTASDVAEHLVTVADETEEKEEE